MVHSLCSCWGELPTWASPSHGPCCLPILSWSHHCPLQHFYPERQQAQHPCKEVGNLPLRMVVVKTEVADTDSRHGREAREPCKGERQASHFDEAKHGTQKGVCFLLLQQNGASFCFSKMESSTEPWMELGTSPVCVCPPPAVSWFATHAHLQFSNILFTSLGILGDILTWNIQILCYPPVY